MVEGQELEVIRRVGEELAAAVAAGVAQFAVGR